MKYALVICDGMEDGPQAALGGQTPQQAAHTPNLDALRWTLSFRNCPEGLSPGSDSAIMSILGADPRRLTWGRGALEALGQGIAIPRGYMAIRANLVSLSREADPLQRTILSTEALEGSDALKAMEALLADPGFSDALAKTGCTLYPQPGHAQLGILPCRSLRLAAPHEHPGLPIGSMLPDDPDFRALILASCGVLDGLALWFWGAGPLPELAPFPLPGGLISGTALCRGIGAAMGLETPRVPGASGTPDTDYAAKAAAAIGLWQAGLPFAAIHVEAPDACSHRRDLAAKVEAISRIDRLLLGPVLRYLQGCGDAFSILVLSDHETLCATGQHTAAPVRAWYSDSTGRPPLGSSPLAVLTGL